MCVLSGLVARWSCVGPVVSSPLETLGEGCRIRNGDCLTVCLSILAGCPCVVGTVAEGGWNSLQGHAGYCISQGGIYPLPSYVPGNEGAAGPGLQIRMLHQSDEGASPPLLNVPADRSIMA